MPYQLINLSTYQLLSCTLHLADNALILSQRNSEWCGHGPVLEQDIAITNISLDLLGQAKNFYAYAAELYNGFSDDEKDAADYLIPRPWKNYGREINEDDLAFLRDENQYLNFLMLELPRGDWAFTILRQFLFSAWQFDLYTNLMKSQDATIAAIADKSLKEVTYHLRWSSEWVIRLGDGTDESHARMQKAVDDLWMYTGEMFEPFMDESLAQGLDSKVLQQSWFSRVKNIFDEATLNMPVSGWMQTGGTSGRHTEHLGYILAEMQYLQRTFPNATW